jgi:ribosome biogenesis GTPase
MEEGIVIKAHSGVYDVQVGSQRFHCSLRHHIIEEDRRRRAETKELPYGDLVAVGDWVRISMSKSEAGVGYIEEILPRYTKFGRSRLNKLPQIIVANLDLLLIIFAARDPELKLRMLDRFLVTAEASGMLPVICINKIDLVNLENLKAQMALYEEIGYQVIYTSVITGAGLDELRAAMKDCISAIVGSSGVGKSSLLNAIQPGLRLRVGEVDERLHKGQHTTTSVSLLPLDFGGFVADTPGLRTLGLLEIDDEQGLDIYFPEMRPYISECKFGACTHHHEPGCAVKAAVESREISEERYDSYLRISGFKEGRYDRAKEGRSWAESKHYERRHKRGKK